MQTFKYSELTIDVLRTIINLKERGVMPEYWEQLVVPLTEEERQQVKFITARLMKSRVFPMNEATIWGRAIYPLLMMAEQDNLQTWAQVALRAQYPSFSLEGIADGVLGKVLSDRVESPYLVVVEAKRGLEAYNPEAQLIGEMLAAARLNWEQNGETPQEIFGCYTITDNRTFVHGLVSEFESDRPAMTVTSSREFAEKTEAETILRILKFITGKYVQKMASAA
jgi:hypothetical protein